MVFWYFTIISTIALTIFMIYVTWDATDNKVLGIIYSIFATPLFFVGGFILTGFISLVIIIPLDGFSEKESKFYFDRKLVSMKDNQTYIISRYGRVDSSLRYYYMSKLNNGYKSYNAPQSNSVVYETDENYRVEIYRTELKNKWLDNQLDYLANKGFDFHSYKYSYKFYVPKGSVKQEFEINME